MQLKLTRSQKTAGMLASSVIFCLDARVEFTPEEAQDIRRYKLHNTVIYNSEASTRHLDRSAAQRDGSALGGLKALASLAMAALNLNISIASLERGQHVECKTLEELLGAEDAIMAACKNLQGFLLQAASFDGSEVLYDFSGDVPTIIARSTTPSPQLIAPAAADYQQAEWEPASDPAGAQYAAREDALGPLLDLHNPETRTSLMVVCGIIVLAIVLKICRII